MKIIIGQNGLGKSKYLNELYDNSDAKVKFIISNTKDNTPSNNLKASATNIWSRLEDFCNKIILKKSELKLDDYFEESISYQNILIDKSNLKAYIDKDAIYKDAMDLKIFDKQPSTLILEENLPIKLLTINKKWKSEEFGLGNIQFQVILVILNVIKKFGKKVLELEKKPEIYIDEPEKHLHPQLIKEISIRLKEISEHIDITLVTHSPLLANYVWSEDAKVIKFIERDQEPVIVRMEHSKLKKFNLSYRESLFNCLLHEKVIVVEDNNILKVVEYYLYEQDIFNFSIVIAGKKTKIVTLIQDLTGSMLIKTKKNFGYLRLWWSRKKYRKY